MDGFVLILILNIWTHGAYQRPVVIQQEFKTLEQCQYVYKTLTKTTDSSKPVIGGCFLK